MEEKFLIMLVVFALSISTLLTGCAPSQTGEMEVQEEQEEQEVQEEQEEQEVQEEQEEQEVQEEQSNMLMSEEEFDRITKCLDEQVPEIGNEWSDYVKDVSEGGAYLYERMAGYSPEDVYRDYEKTEYLGKYYLVYVGEMWEDHSVNWEYFYVSENFDEVLWYDHIARLDNEYPVLYLDEWRNSDFYPALGK